MMVSTGFNNTVNSNEIVAVSDFYSAPTKRMVQDLRAEGKVIDHTQGRRTLSVIFTRSGFVVLSSLSPETISKRISATTSRE